MKEYQLSLVDNISEFEGLLSVWSDLLRRSEKPEFFQQHHWLCLWWKLYAEEEDRLAIIVVKMSDQVVAIAPFYVKNQNKISVLRFIGTGESEEKEVASEYLDIVADDNFNDHIVQLIAKYVVDNLPGIQRIYFNNVLGNSRVSRFCMQLSKYYYYHADIEKVRYRIDLPKTWDEYIDGLKSRSFKGKIRRCLRQFDKLDGRNYQVIDDYSVIQPLFSELVRLHQNRWQEKGKLGAFYSKQFKEFHQSLILNISKLGQVKFLLLQVGGRVIGIFYYFVFNGCCYYYQSGIDDRFRPNISPGILGHSLMLQYCLDNGYQYYDFMGGDKGRSYKSEFCKTSIEMADVVLEKRNTQGMLHICKDSLKSHIKQMIK